MTLTIEEQRLKRIVKEALLEVFEEQQELFYEIVSEVIEDAGLAQAIKEEEDTDYASRDEVTAVLEDDS